MVEGHLAEVDRILPLLREEEVPGVMCRDECLLTYRAEKGCVRSLGVCVEAGCDEDKFAVLLEPSNGVPAGRESYCTTPIVNSGTLAARDPAVADLMTPIATKPIPSLDFTDQFFQVACGGFVVMCAH